CFSNQKHPNAGPFELHNDLGILVSAEECYREVPTLLVGTVDKIVVLGHNPNFRNFFGAATHYCFNHGFIVGGKCRQRILTPAPGGEWNDPAPCPNNSRTSAVRTVPLPAQLDPGIPILDTDELHLEKQDLG